MSAENHPAEVNFTNRAARALRRLQPHLQERVLQEVEDFANNRETVDAQPLKGVKEALYRLRVGGWRIIVRVDLDDGPPRIVVITVIDVRPRGDVYKRQGR